MAESLLTRVVRTAAENVVTATTTLVNGTASDGGEGGAAGSGSKLGAYARELRRVRSTEELMALNKEKFGSALLGADKFASGLIFGFCSGYATRRAFKFGAIACGVSFISLQCLNYSGYVDVNWDQIGEKVQDKLDLNKDGVLDEKDINVAKDRLMKVLTFGIPSAGGFTTGFYMGMKSNWP